MTDKHFNWPALFEKEAEQKDWRTSLQIQEEHGLNKSNTVYFRQRFNEGFTGFYLYRKRNKGTYYYKVSKTPMDTEKDLWRKALGFKPTSTSTLLKKAA